jgi:hypothetical protein
MSVTINMLTSDINIAYIHLCHTLILGAAMERKVMTTLHIRETVRDRFKELVATQDRTMGEVIEDLMSGWVTEHSSGARTERVQMNHAASLLTKAVCEHLSQHTDWAMEALVGAGMGLPGANVFASRITHFSDEKQELGKRLAHWIVLRSSNLIARGKQVVLVCDSGTTVFWFLKALGEAINDHFKTGEHLLRPFDLTIVTNNIPGAETFVTYAALHGLASGAGKARISDLIDCRLLAGSFLPEYVATTGIDTDLDLENFSKLARGEAKGKQHAEFSDPMFIGITTGNWINIRGSEATALPYMLARGRGHGAFKHKLLEVCDEIFMIGPLGKILLDRSVADLNSRLKYSPNAANPQDQSYEEVATPPQKASVTKVVSTIRQERSILSVHSALLRKRLGSYTVLDQSKVATDQTACPIGDVHHLLFPFDQFCNETTETQLEIELPHRRTREESFKREIFSIQP